MPSFGVPCGGSDGRDQEAHLPSETGIPIHAGLPMAPHANVMPHPHISNGLAVVPNDALLEKFKSNLQEVKVRGRELFVLADSNTEFKSEECVHVITVLDHAGTLSPMVYSVPLKLLSYNTALAKGADVDKPRNLAKSVTVE